MYTLDLYNRRLASMPKWLAHNVHYETIMGSVAYGVSSDTSDMDIYGFAIPPKEMIFHHLAGKIQGFGKNVPSFDNYQQHGIKDIDALGGKGRVYDLNIYSIVRYFQLVMENNPNMIDSLFTPESCVLHITRIGQIVRDNRRIFLHKGCWHTFKGYAYSQLHKASSKEIVKNARDAREFEDKYNLPHDTKIEDLDKLIQQGLVVQDDELVNYKLCLKNGSKRFYNVKSTGLETKFLYHVVRLLYEVEMILAEQDLDLQRNREHLKSIRRGEISEQEIRDWASAKEKSLEKLYSDSSLPQVPDEDKIKLVLINCLEEHYGNLNNCIVIQDKYLKCLREIQEKIDTTLKL